jgi:hypothetical protein
MYCSMPYKNLIYSKQATGHNGDEHLSTALTANLSKNHSHKRGICNRLQYCKDVTFRTPMKALNHYCNSTL